MANICYNRFYLSCDKDLDKYINYFKELFESSLDGDIDYTDYYAEGTGGFIEGFFDSRWTFPEDLFHDKFYLEFEGKQDNLYFRCLSEEYGCGYVAMNVFSNGYWKDEQSFCLD